MSETADDVREAIRWALGHAETHSDLLRLLMEIAYPLPGAELRPCCVCSRPVVCEPGYPEGRVACWPCIRAGAPRE